MQKACSDDTGSTVYFRYFFMVRAGMPKCFAVLELLFSHAHGHPIKWKRLNEPKEERRGLFAGYA